MSDREHEQLTQATARELRPGTTLDEETASLREGWLAFGQLLDAAEPENSPVVPLPDVIPNTTPSRPLMPILLVAASLLIAIGAVTLWVISRNSDSELKDLPPIAEESIETNDTASRAVADIQREAQSVLEPEFSWEDAIDDEIAMAGQEIVRLQLDWQGLDEPYRSVEQRLEQLEAGLNEDSL